jgi:hypothetical protein
VATKPKPKPKPRKHQRRTRRGRQRAPAPGLHNFWHRPARPVEFGRFAFRAIATRGQAPGLKLDTVLQGVTWTMSPTEIMAGTLTAHRPRTGPVLKVGDRIKVQYSEWGQEQWRTVFDMRLATPEYQITQDTYTYTLEDEFAHANRSTLTVKFRKDRAHPNGWRADKAIAHVLRMAGVTPGPIPRMKYRAKKLTYTNQTPRTIILNLLAHERRKTGHRYFGKYIGGRLAISSFQRSADLLFVGDYITDGTFTESQKDRFATVLNAYATKEDGKDPTVKHKGKSKGKDSKGRLRKRKRRLHTQVRSRSGIKRYGRVVRSWHAPQADSIAELRQLAKRELARRGRPSEALTISHSGVPTLQRGHALRVNVPQAGLDREIVYVDEITHTVAAGLYTMDITCKFDDPYKDKTKAKSKSSRRRKASKHGRKDPTNTGGAKAPKYTKPRAKKSRQRESAEQRARATARA